MSEPEGEGKLGGGLGKRATEGDPKSKEEGRLGDYARVEVKTQGERAPSYCSLASTLDQQPLPKDKSWTLIPCCLLAPFLSTGPSISLGLSTLFPTRLVCYPLLLRSDVIWKAWVGRQPVQGSLGLPLRALHSLEKSPWAFRSPRSLGTEDRGAL